jgi:glycosyltransferase 2 family protein
VHLFLHDAGSFFHHLAAVDFRALGIACALHALRLAVRPLAWRNIIAAAYPRARIRRTSVVAAYLGGVGLNAIVPARGGDALKLFLVKRRVAGSTYPTLASTLVVETLFDSVVGLALLLWAIHLGALPSLHALPHLPNLDWRWPFRHPLALKVGLPLLFVLLVALLVWLARRVVAFWERVKLGFAILRTPVEYLRLVVTWQALGWGLRLASIYWMLRAFHLPATVHNAVLVQVAQSLSTLLPLTPGGAGTEQGLLLYLFRRKAGRAALLSFSVGAHIVYVVVNVALGAVAVALLTRSLRFGRLREEALRDPKGAEVGDGVARTPSSEEAL